MTKFEHMQEEQGTAVMQELPPTPEFAAEKLLARVTFMRHEETEYTGIGRDITEPGI
jgi:hypothetical protein